MAVNTVSGWSEVHSDQDGEPPPRRIVRDERGSALVAGANTKVVEIVSHQRAYGGTAEEIQQDLPHPTIAQVEAALAYAEEHREEIEEDLATRAREVERLRHEMGQPPVVDKIRKLREQG